jgi:hypothetical protein
MVDQGSLTRDPWVDMPCSPRSKNGGPHENDAIHEEGLTINHHTVIANDFYSKA